MPFYFDDYCRWIMSSRSDWWFSFLVNFERFACPHLNSKLSSDYSMALIRIYCLFCWAAKGQRSFFRWLYRSISRDIVFSTELWRAQIDLFLVISLIFQSYSLFNCGGHRSISSSLYSSKSIVTVFSTSYGGHRSISRWLNGSTTEFIAPGQRRFSRWLNR